MGMDFSLIAWKKGEVVFLGVVVVVIMAVAGGQLWLGGMKARDSQRKADVDLVARALKTYYEDYGIYPAADGTGRIVGCGEGGREACGWGEGTLVDEKNIAYLKKIPRDPYSFRGWSYMYSVSSDRRGFRVYAGLEYERDGGAKRDLTVGCGERVQCKWYAGD